MKEPEYPRETVEFQPVTVTIDGLAVTSGVQFSVVPYRERPGDWDDYYTLDGKIGVFINEMDVGVYRVWARVTDSPEIPVIDCGTFTIS